MKIKTVFVALALLGAFVAYAQQAQAQNPVVDLGAKGAAAMGEGINSMIQTCINTIGASGGLLGAILSVILSMINGLISLVMSILAAVGLGGVAGFCAGVIMGGISGIIGLIAPVIVEILDILQAAGRGIDALCTGGGGLIIVLIADILLTIWQFIGYIFTEIWLGLKLVVGGILGFFGTILGLIPVLGLLTGIPAAILYGIWIAVYIVIGVLGIYLPIGLNAVISGAIAAWSNIGWYNTALHILDYMPVTLLFMASLVTSFAIGATGVGVGSWIGGENIGFAWLGDILLVTIVVLILWVVVAIISLVLFALRLYNILPMIYRFCLDTVCT